MGGLSCVAGKPEADAHPVDTRPTNRRIEERRESQLPWNRQSLQVYCGEPKKKAESSEDKPPDETEKTGDATEDQSLDIANKSQEKCCTETPDSCTPNGVILNESVENEGQEESKVTSDDESLNKDVNNSENAVGTVEESTDSESNDRVPEICVEPPKKHYSLQLINDDCSYKIIKRPRSLDSYDYFGVRKSRPVSFSPALLKTKHPKSLHSITAAVEALKTPPISRQRPQSMDFSGLFEPKGLDIPAQKLRRILTSPKKRKEKKSASNINTANSSNFLQVFLFIILEIQSFLFSCIVMGIWFFVCV